MNCPNCDEALAGEHDLADCPLCGQEGCIREDGGCLSSDVRVLQRLTGDVYRAMRAYGEVHDKPEASKELRNERAGAFMTAERKLLDEVLQIFKDRS
jgi:hypothetical protein